MTDKEKLCVMRNAIDRMDLALHGWPELVDLPEKWGEPRHRDKLGVNVPGNCGQVYEVCDALAKLNDIIHDDEFCI